jgi:hypothetical protein
MALAAVTTTDSNAILRKTYADSVKTLLYGDDSRFLLGALKKTKGGGESFTVPVIYGGQPGRSKTWSNANANKGLAKKVKFSMDWTEDFALALVNNSAISLSQGVGGAVNLKMSEIKSATETLANSIEHSLIRSSYNEIGQIASITGGSNNIVTLVSRNDVNIVDIGQSHVATTSLSTGSLKAPTTPPVVASVDRDAGTITYQASVIGGTPWAVGDYIVQAGDLVTPGTPVSCFGIGAWLPLVAPSGIDIGGVDRSTAPQQLAGVRVDGRGKSAKDAVFDLVTRVGDAGGKGDYILATNDFVGRLVKEIEGQTVYQKVPARDVDGEIAGIFYETVVINGPKGPLKVKGSPFMYNDRVFSLTMDTWEMRISGEGNSKDPIFNATYCSTNAPMIDDPNGDNQIARLKALFLLVCNAPQKNGVTQIA